MHHDCYGSDYGSNGAENSRILFKFPSKLDFGKIYILVYQYIMFLGFKCCREFKQDTNSSYE